MTAKNVFISASCCCFSHDGTGGNSTATTIVHAIAMANASTKLRTSGKAVRFLARLYAISRYSIGRYYEAGHWAGKELILITLMPGRGGEMICGGKAAKIHRGSG